ncbi:MAG: hypothetical protein LBF26_00175 [Puniceicoccales bacterium]|nr:hypothetical protein [Puniceicoccales bacterium]
MSMGVAGPSCNPAAFCDGKNTGIADRLRAGLLRLNIAEGLRAKWEAIGKRWEALGKSEAVGWWVRITNALFGMSEKIVNAVVAHTSQLGAQQIVNKFGAIITNLQSGIADSPNVKILDAHRDEAIIEMTDAMLPPGAHPEDTDVARDAAKQIVSDASQSDYNQRYQEIVRQKLEKLQADYQNIAKNPTRTLPKKELDLLGNPNSSRVDSHLKLAKCMWDLSRIVRYGGTSDMQSNRVNDLSQAHNPDVLCYDPKTDAFISQCMPEIAEFCTKLKREFDESFLAITQQYKANLPNRIASLEAQARQQIADGTPPHQASASLFWFRNEISQMNTLLGYTGNSHAISNEEASAAYSRISAKEE